MAERPVVEFWYEFASSYSYLAAMRVEPAAARAGVAVAWRPFLLGPIFAQQGLRDSPFNLFPLKGQYMWRDMERQTAALGLPLKKLVRFPQNGLLAARCALVGETAGWIGDFSRAVYRAEFGDQADIGEPRTIAAILSGIGQDADAVFEAAQSPANKERLKAQTGRAGALGIFGAPSFTTADGELFWGNDRLEHALAWAAHGRVPA